MTHPTNDELEAMAIRIGFAECAAMLRACKDSASAARQEKPMRCAECNCENGGADCTWIKTPKKLQEKSAPSRRKDRPMSDRHELSNLLVRAAEKCRNMTDEERAEMDAAQKASFIRGMGPCEHGVRDFETCPQCRGWTDTPTPDLPTSKQVTQYAPDGDFSGAVWMTEDPEGGYVRHSDYIALSAKLEASEAERDAAIIALGECMMEIDDYIRQEYPGDHPVHERYRQRDFSANPARVFLQAHPASYVAARQKGGAI